MSHSEFHRFEQETAIRFGLTKIGRTHIPFSFRRANIEMRENNLGTLFFDREANFANG